MSLSADYTPPDSRANDMICANDSSGGVHVSSPFRGGWTVVRRVRSVRGRWPWCAQLPVCCTWIS